MIRTLAILVFVVLGALAFRPSRTHWAYFTFVALGLLFFPASAGFHLQPKPCECALNLELALFSLRNYGHIVLFAIFFLMTSAQVRGKNLSSQILIATGAVLAMGACVELSEGLSGQHHCRLRDLVPDLAGAMVGAVLLMAWKLARKNRGASRAGGVG